MAAAHAIPRGRGERSRVRGVPVPGRRALQRLDGVRRGLVLASRSGQYLSRARGRPRLLPVFAGNCVAVRTALPWIVFVSGWYAILVAALVFLGRGYTLALLAIPFVAVDLYHGNLHLLIAAAIVLGFRYPAAWGFVVLTKVTPGIGLLWFAVRREWRSLGIALGATTVVAAVTFVLLPSQWIAWINVLIDNAGTPPPWPALPIPLWVRLPAAALIIVWGARRDARWVVPVAAAISVPALWPGAFAMVAACWALRRVPADQERGYHAADVGQSRGESEPAAT
jgi:Glycosyltransferase family 87